MQEKTIKSNYYTSMWSGDFGNKYTDRCQIDYIPRVPVFSRLFEGLDIESVLEVGCNMGHNLQAIEHFIPNIQGVEVNKYAIKQSEMRERVVVGEAQNLPWIDESFNMVFTAGVLIHIEEKDLKKVMSEMYRVSNRYIMMIEYPNEEQVGRRYRDFDDKEGVWSRPYGRVIENMLDVKRVKQGHMKDISNEHWGFSKDCDYWIYEK